MTAKTFPIETILSCTTGFLCAENGMSGVHELMAHVCGFPVWTHQIPRLRRDVAAELCRQHPDLPSHEDAEALGFGPDTYAGIIAGWRASLGTERSIEPAPVGTFEQRDPVAEAIERVGPNRVILVPP